MCVLGLYTAESDKSKVDACTISLESIKQPLIKFDDGYAEYRSKYASKGIDSKFIKLNKKTGGGESFYLAEYGLSGIMISFKKASLNSLMQCRWLGGSEGKKCSISVEDLVRNVKLIEETRFYELFLSTDAELGNSTMLPVGVRIVNNDEKFGQDLLYKRFFLLDGVSSKPGRDTEPVYIRYAKSIKLYYELVASRLDGVVYPPVLLIEYDHVRVADKSVAEVRMEFGSEYRMDYKIQSRNLWISVGVLLFLGLVWSLVRTWCWNCRSGKYACDLISLFKFFMFFAEAVGKNYL